MDVCIHVLTDGTDLRLPAGVDKAGKAVMRRLEEGKIVMVDLNG